MLLTGPNLKWPIGGTWGDGLLGAIGKADTIMGFSWVLLSRHHSANVTQPLWQLLFAQLISSLSPLAPPTSREFQPVCLIDYLQVQHQIINNIINSPPTLQFSHSKDQSDWTLILSLSCYSNTIVNNVCQHMQHLCYTLSHSILTPIPWDLWGKDVPAGWVNGPSAAALGFLNCHCFGPAIWRGNHLEPWCAWKHPAAGWLGVAWGTESRLWGSPDLLYHLIQLLHFTNGRSWSPEKGNNLPRIMSWK